MSRAVLATWLYVVVTRALFVIWPMEGTPVRHADDPLIRSLLLSLTGIGGPAIVDALHDAKF